MQRKSVNVGTSIKRAIVRAKLEQHVVAYTPCWSYVDPPLAEIYNYNGATLPYTNMLGQRSVRCADIVFSRWANQVSLVQLKCIFLNHFCL